MVRVLLSLVLAVCVAFVLAAFLPITQVPALILVPLGKYGAISYKGLAGFFVFGALYNRL